jgi:tRNA A-37 threonylcarbamoyl transferase component Bud32
VRFGRYELLRPLGKGGMAEVFLARYVGPEGFQKQLVIKRVLPELGTERRFLRLFFDEARTHVSLSHGNLVHVFDFGRVGNAYFIAMEHVPGCDLGTLLADVHKRGQGLPAALVAHLGIELCRGLAYVHRREFVHRDVSPRNVLLSTEGEVKLADFGVALTAASDDRAGVRGTLAYMAPEQARGESTDGRADLFALAMVLAEALTGRRLRVSPDTETALATAREPPPLELEGSLGALLERATARAPDDRFADAEAMLIALEKELARYGQTSAAAARELAARVKQLALPSAQPPEDDVGEALTTAETVGEESYFRDRQDDRFVDEMLAETPEPSTRRGRRRRTRLLLAGAGAIATLSLLAAGRAALRARATMHAVIPPPITTAIAPRRVTAPAQPVVPPAPPVPTRPRPPTKRATDTGMVLVRCTPWCIPYVDEKARGQDGRRHELELPVGSHRVAVKRLDDRLERAVEVRPGELQTVEFTFE